MARPHTLQGLRINEVSLVDAPANPHAFALLFKRKDTVMPKPAAKASETALERMLTRLGLGKRASLAEPPDPDTYGDAAAATVDKATQALATSISSILGDDAVLEKTAAITQSLAEFRAHLGEAMPEQIEKAMRDVALATATRKDDTMPTHDELTATVAELTKQLADSRVALAKAKKAPAEPDPDPDAAADAAEPADPKKKPLFGKQDTPEAVALAKALAETADLHKRVAGFEAERELLAMQKRAVEVGAAPAQAEVLLKASKGDLAAFDTLLGLLKAANAQAKSGALFKEFGAVGGPVDGSAAAEVESLAQAMIKTTPTLSPILARVQVRKAQPELAQRERNEERATARATA